MVGQTISHYRILEKLGAGGMGIVYLAEDIRLDRQVALKILPPEFAVDEARGERFLREARAVATLNHPGIAILYEIGETSDTQFLAMEYISGKTLQEELAAGPFSKDRLAEYTTQIAEALEHAHRHGILHRDIKPANMIVSPEGKVKLLDFGLAKLAERNDRTASLLTAPGSWLGTLHYAAPEVLRGYPADRRSDIYSFGVVLYQMACGHLPFEGVDGRALISAILTGQAPSPHTRNPLIDPALEACILSSIALQPDQRPQSALELARSVRESVSSTGSHAKPAQAMPVLAVLDFQNTSDDPSVNWLGTGLAETLTSDLKRLKLVKVVTRERLQEAARRHAASGQAGLVALGREIGARWLVLGSFQRAGGRLRILPRVLEVSTGEETPITKADGTWEEVFELQDRVVAGVMSALEVKVDSSAMERIAAPDTIHLEAYEQYAQGRQDLYEIGKDSLERARQHLERAVALDPNYALAYAALGATHAMRFIHRTDPTDLDSAARYCERALELDPELGEPYPWLTYAYVRQGKVQEGIRTGIRGVERQPDLVLSHYFLSIAYMVETEQAHSESYSCAAKSLLNAAFVDARWAPTWLCLGSIALACGEYDQAERFLEKGYEIERRGSGFGYFIGCSTLLGTVADRRGSSQRACELYLAARTSLESCDHVYREAFLTITACGLGDVVLRQGNAEAALMEFRRASRLVKEYPRMLGKQRVLTLTLAGTSAAYAAMGDLSRARQFLDEALPALSEVARSPHTWIWGASLGQLRYLVAKVYVLVGELDRALDMLAQAVEGGWRDHRWMSSDPSMAPLSGLPQFNKLLEDLKALPTVDFQASTSKLMIATQVAPA
ncbi:MAG TPA: protein kinase [Candidatus Sulfotelmatobacter sp.]|nr:protein kinase [Candidatus Sulfotelmatobacter sp.]